MIDVYRTVRDEDPLQGAELICHKRLEQTIRGLSFLAWMLEGKQDLEEFKGAHIVDLLLPQIQHLELILDELQALYDLDQKQMRIVR